MRLGWVTVLAVYGAVSFLGDPRAALMQFVDQKEVVAACLVLEAGGEGPEGMQGVMNVIQNRAEGEAGRFYAEVTRPWQFSSLNNAPGVVFKDYSGVIARARQSPAWKEAEALVGRAYGGDLPDITGGATHFYATRRESPPDWAVGSKETLILGGHRFLALR